MLICAPAGLGKTWAMQQLQRLLALRLYTPPPEGDIQSDEANPSAETVPYIFTEADGNYLSFLQHL